MNRPFRAGLWALASVSSLLLACGDDKPAGGGGAGVTTIKLASLNGAQEVPANASTAIGTAVVSVNETTGQVRGFIVTSGLAGANAAHIHIDPRGTATPGNVIVPMTGGPDLWVVPDGAAPLTAAQIAAWKSNGLYVNVHTATLPNGEIRGQLDKAATTVRFASLTGAQEVPATGSAAIGGGLLAVDGSGAVSGFIVTSGLVGGNVAHVHTGARGTAPAANVILPLAGGPNLWFVPDNATPLTAAQVADLGAGNLYYNAHTGAFPTGEIRGQLVGSTTGGLRLATLDGAQEVPAVTTSAFGAGILGFDSTSGQPSGFLVTSGLVSPTLAHVHDGARGSPPAPVVTPLTGPAAGGIETARVWPVPEDATPYSAQQQADFAAGNLYFNAHTSANPIGEIRGQLDRGR
jgi:hypothetical protein